MQAMKIRVKSLIPLRRSVFFCECKASFMETNVQGQARGTPALLALPVALIKESRFQSRQTGCAPVLF